MLYIWLKLIHILSSTILFGTGIGTASVMLYGYFQPNMEAKLAIYRYVALVDWFFTGISGLIQPITGLAMVYVAGYSLSMFWISISILGYLIAAFCWFGVVYFQLKIRDITANSIKHKKHLPAIYYQFFTYWFMVGWPAFISLIVVFYLMTAKPI